MLLPPKLQELSKASSSHQRCSDSWQLSCSLWISQWPGSLHFFFHSLLLFPTNAITMLWSHNLDLFLIFEIPGVTLRTQRNNCLSSLICYKGDRWWVAMDKAQQMGMQFVMPQGAPSTGIASHPGESMSFQPCLEASLHRDGWLNHHLLAINLTFSLSLLLESGRGRGWWKS